MQAVTRSLGGRKLIDRIQKEPGPIKPAHISISGLRAASLFDRKGHDLCAWPPCPNDLHGRVAFFNRKHMTQQDHVELLVAEECHDLFNAADRAAAYRVARTCCRISSKRGSRLKQRTRGGRLERAMRNASPLRVRSQTKTVCPMSYRTRSLQKRPC